MTANNAKLIPTCGSINLSVFARFDGVIPEFAIIFVSDPVKRTTPMTHFVLRKTVPLSNTVDMSTGDFVGCVPSLTTAALSLNMLTSAASLSIL